MTFHDEILTNLLKYRERNPDFIFIPRQRNTQNKLIDGYWFQGNSDYAFVGLINRSGGMNKTRSLGFVFWPDKDFYGITIELVHKGEKDQEVLGIYATIKNKIGGFEEKEPEKFVKYIGNTSKGYDDVFKFLDEYYQKIIDIVEESGRTDLLLNKNKFNKFLDRIKSRRKKLIDEKEINKLLINITWNSKDWKEESQDDSNHRYVKEGNIPGESWNFAKNEAYNNGEYLHGFAQFTNPPGISGKSIFIFYSQGKIVGFYGNAEVGEYSPAKDSYYNLRGQKNISFVLNNKIEDVKEKGYLEDKQRLGMAGFNYLHQDATIIKILDEALKLNPEQKDEIENLKKWFTENTVTQPTPLKTRNENSNNNQPTTMNTERINEIYFGPPGTGKTYNSINRAVEIVDKEYYEDHKNDRAKIRERFQELLIRDWNEPKGQIAFCTFHQSFTYEDFVEGIKPVKPTEDDTYLKYDIEDGVFKRICRLSDDQLKAKKVKEKKLLTWNQAEYDKASFYKISLGDIKKQEDNEIYEYCIENGVITIGFGGGEDYSGLSESEVRQQAKDLDLQDYDAQALNYFIHYLKKGNYVLVSKGNGYVRAMGKVTGDYYYKPDSPIRYSNFRSVDWIFTDEEIPIDQIYDKQLSQMTIYKLNENKIKEEFFIGTHSSEKLITEAPVEQRKNYVLIIDEINRGNISSIFGELITLIENDKRAGGNEELEVTLPYSKETFKVPDNVFILGTMNTADRSIEALDTALRRRFCFKEFPPRPSIVQKEGTSGKIQGNVDSIDLKALLTKINKRIEKLIDKDHLIGHSYFLKVDSTKKLKSVFKNEIIPLLEEYFFGDYGKIGLVLGSSFVEKVNSDSNFANFPEYDQDIQEDLLEKSVYKIRKQKEWDFHKI